MMGYTHEAIGAGGALAAALLFSQGNLSPEQYVVASVAGVLGGIIVDADVVDQKEPKKVTDGSRSRLAAIVILAVGILLDVSLNMGILAGIISRQNLALGGTVALIILGFIAHLIGIIIGHRTFSHSLWFIGLTTICIYFICPLATGYFFLGAILHLLFDLLNNQAQNKDETWHGIWPLYPIKKGNGIALKKCKAFGAGNTALYFIAILLFAVMTGYYVWMIKDSELMAVPIILLVVIILVLRHVRRKSEKEIQNK